MHKHFIEPTKQHADLIVNTAIPTVEETFSVV